VIPVDQTRHGDDGNCLEACVASVMECAIEDVPVQTPGNSTDDFVDYLTILNDWLQERGAFLTYFAMTHEQVVIYPCGWWIACLSSGNPNYRHSVVAGSDRVFHDPHHWHSRAQTVGLEQVEAAIVLGAANPAAVSRFCGRYAPVAA
jgi:hypothetical protein